MKKALICGGLTLIFLLFAPLGAEAYEACVTTGDGYASPAQKPLQEILNLRSSLRPEDQQRLKDTIARYSADRHIFVPNAGIQVEVIYYGDRAKPTPILVRPVGSEEKFWIFSTGLKNCQEVRGY